MEPFKTGGDAIDWASLRENCAGDESLVNEVLELFRKEAPALLADVRTAVTQRDALQVKRTAHRLKGALVSLAAGPATQAARALELSGGGNDLATVDLQFLHLEAEMQRLLSAVSVPHAA
jgi:two-component system sensor histidine kinase/response regulator